MGISEGFVGFGNWIKLQHFVAFVAVVKVVVVVAVVVGKEEGEVETKFARFAVGAGDGAVAVVNFAAGFAVKGQWKAKEEGFEEKGCYFEVELRK